MDRASYAVVIAEAKQILASYENTAADFGVSVEEIGTPRKDYRFAKTLVELDHWLDNNTTFYNVRSRLDDLLNELEAVQASYETAGSNDIESIDKERSDIRRRIHALVPGLTGVSKRIWYHATNDTESYPFTAVAVAAIEKQK